MCGNRFINRFIKKIFKFNPNTSPEAYDKRPGTEPGNSGGKYKSYKCIIMKIVSVCLYNTIANAEKNANMFELEFGFLSNTRNKSKGYVYGSDARKLTSYAYQVFDKMFIESIAPVLCYKYIPHFCQRIIKKNHCTRF